MRRAVAVMAVMAVTAAALAGGACTTPTIQDGTVACGADRSCPPGFQCRAQDDMCWRDELPGDAGPDPVDAASDAAPVPPLEELLSETGLYADPVTKTLAPDLLAFAPTYQLWSDGAQTTRWLKLPPGGVIDTRDMDHWVFPVGTRVFKQFERAGVLLETQMIYRFGAGDEDYYLTAYAWAEDQSDAVRAPTGVSNIHRTDHDVLSADRCLWCHEGEPGHVLGVSAMQLSRLGAGVTIGSLAADERLSDPPLPGHIYSIPGSDQVTRRALGYLHANCGHCHNPSGGAWRTLGVKMYLRTYTDETSAEDTRLYESTIGQPLVGFAGPSYTTRVVAGKPGESALFFRMGSRGSFAQMPPVATEFPDPDGIDAVRAWIEELP